MMKILFMLFVALALNIFQAYGQEEQENSRYLQSYKDNSCYNCLDTGWPSYYFCKHKNSNSKEWGACCNKYSNSYDCQVKVNTSSCSDEAVSFEMQYSYCLAITNVQCGNVNSLSIDATTSNQTVTLSNVLRSDNTACYWAIQTNSSWSSSAVTSIIVNSFYGFNVSFVNGTSRQAAKTSYYNITHINTKNNTKYTFTGSGHYIYLVAVPLKSYSKNSLNFTFSLNGTYVGPSAALTWFESNKIMIIAVSSGGGGLIILVVAIFIAIKCRKNKSVMPEGIKMSSMTPGIKGGPSSYNKMNQELAMANGVPYGFSQHSPGKFGHEGDYNYNQVGAIKLDDLIPHDQNTLYDSVQQPTWKQDNYAGRGVAGGDQGVRNPKELTVDYWAKNVPQQVKDIDDPRLQRKRL